MFCSHGRGSSSGPAASAGSTCRFLSLCPLSLKPNHKPIRPFSFLLWGLQAPRG